MKINNFWADLTDISAKKDALLQIFEGWTRALLGGGSLPAVEKGGIRTIRVPPELAFGQLGNACIFGLPDKCLVPPNSPVDITFEYLGYK